MDISNIDFTTLFEQSNLKSQISDKLEIIKVSCDLSTLDFSSANDFINFHELNSTNLIARKYTWDDIAKLSMNLVLDFKYYSQFQFRSRFGCHEYENALKELGYRYENNLWTFCGSPDRNVVMKNIVKSCIINIVYKESQKNSVLDNTRDEDKIQTMIQENYLNSMSWRNKDKICPICESPNKPSAQQCDVCQFDFTSSDDATVVNSEMLSPLDSFRFDSVQSNNREELQLGNYDENEDSDPLDRVSESDAEKIESEQINYCQHNSNEIAFPTLSIDLKERKPGGESIMSKIGDSWECEKCCVVNKSSMVNCTGCLIDRTSKEKRNTHGGNVVISTSSKWWGLSITKIGYGRLSLVCLVGFVTWYAWITRGRFSI